MKQQLSATQNPSHVDLYQQRFLRLNDVLALIPVSRTTWWKGINDGRFPKSVRLSQRTVAWRAVDIMNLVAELSQSQDAR